MIRTELTEDHWSQLAPLLQRHTFAAGEVVIRSGEAPAGLLIIERGRLAVRTGDDNAIELAQVGPGDLVGEVALLDPGPASATVVALTEGEVAILSAEGLARFGQVDPKGARLLTRFLSRTLAGRLRAVTGKALVWKGEQPTLTEAPKARGWFSRLFAALGGPDTE